MRRLWKCWTKRALRRIAPPRLREGSPRSEDIEKREVNRRIAAVDVLCTVTVTVPFAEAGSRGSRSMRDLCKCHPESRNPGIGRPACQLTLKSPPRVGRWAQIPRGEYEGGLTDTRYFGMIVEPWQRRRRRLLGDSDPQKIFCAVGFALTMWETIETEISVSYSGLIDVRTRNTDKYFKLTGFEWRHQSNMDKQLTLI